MESRFKHIKLDFERLSLPESLISFPQPWEGRRCPDSTTHPVRATSALTGATQAGGRGVMEELQRMVAEDILEKLLRVVVH